MSAGLFPEERVATFSDDRAYRYRLEQWWDINLPPLVCCLTNPSTADGENDDATSTRMLIRAKGGTKWQRFGGLVMVNAFAYVCTDSSRLPYHCEAAKDIVGPDNNRHLRRAFLEARNGLLVFGWGQPGNLLNRGAAVVEMAKALEVQPHAYRINKDGTPGHPLYISFGTPAIPFP